MTEPPLPTGESMRKFIIATIGFASLFLIASVPGQAQTFTKTLDTIQLEQFTSIYGGGADTGRDSTAALNVALNYAKANKIKNILFSKGTYTFTSKPISIDFGISLIGQGKGRTLLYRQYNETNSEGLLTFIGGSGSATVSDLGIVAANNTSGGSAIKLVGTMSGSPDFFFV